MSSTSFTTSPTARPFLTRVLERKRRLNSASSAAKWALLNFGAAGIVSGVIFNQKQDFSGLQTAFFYILLLIFVVNFVLDVFTHFFPLGISPGNEVVMTKEQMRLLRVNEADPGFKMSPEQKKLHPNPFSPPLEGSFILNANQTVSPQGNY